MDSPNSQRFSSIQKTLSHKNRSQKRINALKNNPGRRYSFHPCFKKKKNQNISSKNALFSVITNLQIQCSNDIQKAIFKLNKLQEENQKLRNNFETLNTKIDNILASTTSSVNYQQTNDEIFVTAAPEAPETFSNEPQIISTPDTTFFDQCPTIQNHSTIEISEPNWIVEKNKCYKLIEKSQNQISHFLSFYLPEIYNSAELISPAYFPEADQKHQEINAIINYFWKNQSTQDFYAKAIEKELQIQRYKVTRKIYYLLKTTESCIMGKDGKVYDCKNDKTQSMMFLNDENTYTEWFIPNELIYDDYIIGAKKDETNNKTFIYKLILTSLSMTLIYTKRK